MDDIGAPVGIMVAPHGYDKGARARAQQLSIFLIHATWDLLVLAKGLDVDGLDFYVCQECPTVADEHDSLGVVNWRHPKTRHSPAWGACGFCNAAHAICPDCSEVTGFSEGDEGRSIECAGGCERIYVVTFDSREGERHTWTLSGVERRILQRAHDANGFLPLAKALGIVAKSKWQFAPKNPEAPIPRLVAEDLTEIDKAKSRLVLTDDGEDTVSQRIAKATSGYYGW